jgi:tetratricopeptide (TPR) repeat protein
MSLLLKALSQVGKTSASTAGDAAREAISNEPRFDMGGAGARWDEPPGARVAATLLGRPARNISIVPMTLGLAALVALAYGGYIWWAMQPGSSFSASPSTTTPAAQPVATLDTIPAPAAAEPTPTVAPLPAESAPPKAMAAPVPAARRAPTLRKLYPARTPPVTSRAEAPRDHPLNRAYEAFLAGRLDEAQAAYTQALTEDPSPEAHLGLAAIAVRRERLADAVKHYGEALRLDPRNATAHAGLISTVGVVDPAAAEARLKELIAVRPMGYLHATLGDVYASGSRWAEAEGAYYEAHKLEPANPDHAYNLAVALERLNQSKIAVQYYERALMLARNASANFDVQAVQARLSFLKSPHGG